MSEIKRRLWDTGLRIDRWQVERLELATQRVEVSLHGAQLSLRAATEGDGCDEHQRAIAAMRTLCEALLDAFAITAAALDREDLMRRTRDMPQQLSAAPLAVRSRRAVRRAATPWEPLHAGGGDAPIDADTIVDLEHRLAHLETLVLSLLDAASDSTT